MQTHNPRVRSDLLISEVGSEMVIYDTGSHQAHSLSEKAARVWRLTDGTRTLDDIAQTAANQFQIEEAAVFQALDEFATRGLLEKDKSLSGLTRRAVLGKVAVGAALPLVISILAPTPAAAASGGNGNGNNGGGQEKRGEDDGAPPGFEDKDKPEKDPPP